MTHVQYLYFKVHITFICNFCGLPLGVNLAKFCNMKIVMKIQYALSTRHVHCLDVYVVYHLMTSLPVGRCLQT